MKHRSGVSYADYAENLIGYIARMEDEAIEAEEAGDAYGAKECRSNAAQARAELRKHNREWQKARKAR